MMFMLDIQLIEIGLKYLIIIAGVELQPNTQLGRTFHHYLSLKCPRPRSQCIYYNWNPNPHKLTMGFPRNFVMPD